MHDQHAHARKDTALKPKKSRPRATPTPIQNYVNLPRSGIGDQGSAPTLPDKLGRAGLCGAMSKAQDGIRDVVTRATIAAFENAPFAIYATDKLHCASMCRGARSGREYENDGRRAAASSRQTKNITRSLIGIAEQGEVEESRDPRETTAGMWPTAAGDEAALGTRTHQEGHFEKAICIR